MGKSGTSTAGDGGTTTTTIDHPLLSQPSVLWAWNHVLSDYCDFKDIRNVMATCKSLHQGLPPLIRTLRIKRCAELNVNFARKLPHVQDVQVFSLIERDLDGHSYFYYRTSRAVVPFLECFPDLKSALIAGFMPVQLTEPTFHDSMMGVPRDFKPDVPKYSVNDCITEDHEEEFMAMLESLCDAFERGTLNNSTLRLKGILENKQLSRRRETGNLERRIMELFPVDVLVKATRFLHVDKWNLWRCIHRRDPNCIKNSDLLYEILIGSYAREILTVAEAHRKHCEPAGDRYFGSYTGPGGCLIVEYKQDFFDLLDQFCSEFGCNPRDMSWDRLFEGYHQAFLWRKDMNRTDLVIRKGEFCMTRKTFDQLMERGIPMNKNDFTVLVPLGPRTGRRPFPMARPGDDREYGVEDFVALENENARKRKATSEAEVPGDEDRPADDDGDEAVDESSSSGSSDSHDDSEDH